VCLYPTFYIFECFSELNLSIQGIFTDYKQPFAVTYLGASLMVVYLPIAFIKDWLYNLLKIRSSKSGIIVKVGDEISLKCSSPLKGNGVQKHFEVELGSVTRKDSDIDLATLAEVKPLVAKSDDANVPVGEKKLTTKEIATYGFYIAPIWFITEVSGFRLIPPFCS
jgi:solute carrier family 35 protein F5